MTFSINRLSYFDHKKQVCKSINICILLGFFQGDGVLDIVVSADPEHVPYSVLVMLKLLQEKFRVRSSTHTHSSVTAKCPTYLTPSSNDRSNYQIILTLIWKKGLHHAVVILILIK